MTINMTWKKASIIIGVILGLIALYPYIYKGVGQVNALFSFDFAEAQAFNANTKDRHDWEDLDRMEYRLVRMNEIHGGTASMDSQTLSEYIRLQNRINKLKKKLGLLGEVHE